MATSPALTSAMEQQYPQGATITPGAPGPEDAAPQEDGFTICIHVAGDGTISVGLENEAAEATGAEDPTAEQQENAGMEEMPDIKAALTKALALYRSEGQSTAETNFDQGFKGE